MYPQNPLDDAAFDTGKKWKDGAGVIYRVLRKKIVCAALPNNTTKNVPHGEAGIDPNKFIKLSAFWASKNDGSPALNETTSLVAITVDATNVKLTTGADQTAYTLSEVILEWAQA